MNIYYTMPFPQVSVTTSIVQFAQPNAPYALFRLAPLASDPLSAQVTLEELGKLKDDWDGYGGLAVTPDSRAHAANFLAATPRGMVSPDIAPTSNGTITFEWESDDGDAMLEIGRTRYSGHIQPKYGATIYLHGTLGTPMEQQLATEQVLAVIKELLYAGSGPKSLTHSIQIPNSAF